MADTAVMHNEEAMTIRECMEKYPDSKLLLRTPGGFTSFTPEDAAKALADPSLQVPMYCSRSLPPLHLDAAEVLAFVIRKGEADITDGRIEADAYDDERRKASC